MALSDAYTKEREEDIKRYDHWFAMVAADVFNSQVAKKEHKIKIEDRLLFTKRTSKSAMIPITDIALQTTLWSAISTRRKKEG